MEEAAQSGFQKGDTELAVGEPSSSPFRFFMFFVGSSMCVKFLLQFNIDTLFIFPKVSWSVLDQHCFGAVLFGP